MTKDMGGSPTAPEVECLDALSRLNRLFGGELWKAKADTSAAAFESLSAVDTDSAKRDELGKHFSAWKERVAAAIHKWVGKYFALARSNPAVAGSAGKWVEEQVLSRLQAQCFGHGPLEGPRTFTRDGIKYLEPLEWWLRYACDGKLHWPVRPWVPPDWIVPVVDSQLLHQASLTRELLSALDAAIVEALNVTGYERETPARITDRTKPPLRKRKGRPKDITSAIRTAKIWEIAQLRVIGEAYCKALDDREINTPARWQRNEGCPKLYLEAFNHKDRSLRKKWRQRISDEKYKATRSKPLAKTRN
jgi:hypothetical protein